MLTEALNKSNLGNTLTLEVMSWPVSEATDFEYSRTSQVQGSICLCAKYRYCATMRDRYSPLELLYVLSVIII